MAKVKALCDWTGGTYGSRAKGESFEYDTDKDPDGLVKLGFVEVTGTAAKPGGDKAQG